MKLLLALLTIVLAPLAAATTICDATSRGPVCRHVCAPNEQWNNYLQRCASSSCPAGTVAGPLHGGGYNCIPTAASGTADAGAACADSSGHIVPCSTLIPGEQTRCRMAVEWVLLDPEHPTVAEITPACADEADLASSATTTKILKLAR